MTLDFACPECNRRLRVPAESAGKHCKCPGCQVVVPIPKSNSNKAIDQRKPINSQQVTAGYLPLDRIQVACPKCAHLLECDAKLQGTRGLCKNCNAIFTISTDPDDREVEVASFVFACPFCKKLFDGKPELAGRRAKCDSCQSVFQIEQVKTSHQPVEPISPTTQSQKLSPASQPDRVVQKTPASPASKKPVLNESSQRSAMPNSPKQSPQPSKPETTFAIECPTCAKHVDVNSKLVGKTIACPGCRTQMIVPSLEQDEVTDLGAFSQENFALDQYAQPSDPFAGSMFPSQSANPFADPMPAANTNFYAAAPTFRPTTSKNPYAAPAHVGSQAASDGSAEAIRRKHLSHEASIKSFGFLYLLGSVFGCLVSVAYCLVGVGALSRGGQAAVAGMVVLFVGTILLAVSIFQGFTGYGLRKLTTFGRIGGTVCGAIGLLGFPLGTIIAGYLLYLLWSEKGNVVFSPRYQRVMEATPHIKYKTSIIVWILLGFIGLAVLVGIIAMVTASSSR